METISSKAILEIIKTIKQAKQVPLLQLVSQGYLDSFDIINLVDHLEKKFNIVISGEEINLDNFDSIEAITNLVKRLTPQN